MIIPREDDLVRMYIQISDPVVLGAMNAASNGRVDREKVGPLDILAVGPLDNLREYTPEAGNPGGE